MDRFRIYFYIISFEEKTINRIRNYFPICHSLIYVKRNLYDYPRTLGRLNVSSSIIDYSESLNYLLNNQVYDLLKITQNHNYLNLDYEGTMINLFEYQK